MGISLNNTTPAVTYPALIKFGDNFGLTTTLKNLSDGEGNDLPIQVKNNQVNIVGTLTQNGQPVTTPPSGVSGAIQFSNGSAFASDAANLFWDDTNNRLGIGTNAPTTSLQIDYASSSLNGILINQTGGTGFLSGIGLANNGNIKSTLSMNLNSGEVRWYVGAGGYYTTIYSNNQEAMRIDTSQNVNIGAATLGARLGIRGSGSTSATTALLVQNSAGTNLMRIPDSGRVVFGIDIEAGTFFGQVYIPGKLFLKSNGEAVFGDDSLNSSAVLQANSTTKGFLPPRMTTTQKNAIASPASGLVVYDSTTNKLCCYNGSTWNDLF